MYLAHIPINHHLRGLWRAVAALSGLYLVALGVYGIVETLNKASSLFTK